MATWVEEGALADMKQRLDKLRIDQSRQKVLEDEEAEEKPDSLKLLQSKFGSMVYDPTSPTQRAYERSCARMGRRKSIEFEDLYKSKGSGSLHHGILQPSSSSSSTTTTQRHGRHSIGASGPQRMRKSSDPSQYYRKMGLPPPSDLHAPRSIRHEGQGHRLLTPTVSEEDKHLVDQKLSKIGGEDSTKGSPPQQRRRKISSPSKFPITKH